MLVAVTFHSGPHHSRTLVFSSSEIKDPKLFDQLPVRQGFRVSDHEFFIEF